MSFEYYVRFQPDSQGGGVELALAYCSIFKDDTLTVYLVARGRDGQTYSATLTDPDGRITDAVPHTELDMAWEYLDHAIVQVDPPALRLRIPRDDNYSPLAMSSENFDPDLLCHVSDLWPFTLRFYA